MTETTWFFNELFGAGFDGGRSCMIWTLPDKVAHRGSSPDDAATAAAVLNRSGQNVYVHAGMGAVDERRLRAIDVTAIPGLWADVDIADRDGKTSKRYAPDLKTARDLIDGLPIKPSIILDTGGGLHAWWLLHEMVLIPGLPERQDAAVMLKGWGDTLTRHWAASGGWTLDNVSDLARVMRVPGTINHKYGRPVEVLEHSGERFSREQIDAAMWTANLGKPEPAPAAGFGDVAVQAPRADVDADDAVRLAESDRAFAKIWQRRRPDLADQSASSYDMAIASDGVRRGWSDQQIANTIVAWRRLRGEDVAKGQRLDYLQRTLWRARHSDQGVSVAIQRRADAGEITSPAEAYDAVTQLVGLPVVGFVRWLVEPPEYLIQIADGDERRDVSLGTAAQVLEYRHARGVLFDQGVMLGGGRAAWATVTAMLLPLAVDHDEPDDTLERVLSSYLEKRHPDCLSRRWSDLAAKSAPFHRDGLFYVHPADLWAFCSRNGEASTRRDVLQMFKRRPEWVQKTVSLGQTSRSYRMAPIDRVAAYVPAIQLHLDQEGSDSTQQEQHSYD